MTIKARIESLRDQAKKSSAMALLLIVYASNVLASIDQSLMNVALDNAAEYFSVSLSMANWMVLGFSIMTGTVIMSAASLLARFGLRKIFFLSYAFSLAGSALGLLSWDFGSMVVARFLQAVTTGLFFPCATVAILAIAPEGKKATLLSLNAAIIGVGLAVSPSITGALITYAGLKSVFAVPLGLALVLLVVGPFVLRDVEPRADKKIDVASVILAFIGLMSFMYGLNIAMHEGLVAAGFMAAGALALFLFARRQRRLKDPLLNLAPLRNGAFTLGELIGAAAYMGSRFMSLLVPLFLEGTAGLSPFAAGCYLTVPILVYAASSYVGGRIEDAHGIWPLVPLGMLVVLAGLVGVELAAGQSLVTVLVTCAGVTYLGVGLVFPSIKSRDLELVRPEVAKCASSIHSTFVQVVSSISSALFVGIMSADVDRLMAAKVAKDAAYASGFSSTLIIAIVIASVASVVSIVFAYRVHRRR